MKPYFLNMRTWYEFPFYKKLIWIAFGKRTVGEDEGYRVVAYTLFNITYINECEVK